MGSSWKVALAGALVAIGCGDNVAPLPGGNNSPGNRDDGGPEDAQVDAGRCKDVDVALETDALYVQLVADGSASMSVGSKWTSEVAAIRAAIETARVRSARQISAGKLPDTAMGLIVFGDSGDSTLDQKGPYPSAVDVPIQAVGDGAAATLSARLGSSPASIGASKAALQGAYGSLRAYMAPVSVRANGRRAAILISDGMPETPPGDAIAIATSSAGSSPSIVTFPIGLGDGTSYGSFMVDLAVAGGTAAPDCDRSLLVNPTCFHQVDPSGKSASQITSELVGALDSLLPSDCRFVLPTSVPSGSARIALVGGNGAETAVAPDRANGWTYDATAKVVLANGNTCAALKADPKASLRARVSCQ